MKSALLLIDVQKIYTTAGSPLLVEGHEIAIDHMNKLIAHADARGDLVVYIRHVHKKNGADAGRMFDYLGTAGEIGFVEETDDVELDPRLKISSNGISLTKNRYSAFVNTTLDQLLKQRQINRIVVTGFMTDYCCETTARHAHDLDYYVDFVIDATGCPDAAPDIRQPQIKAVSAAVLQGGFAQVLTTDDYLGRK
ncbi:MAG: isochorismatase family cysteine hydrolase [Dongiaceae bacterium]